MGLPVWSAWLLSALFAATLLVCVSRWLMMREHDAPAGCGHDDRWGAAAHAVMAGAMMLMLVPVPGLVPGWLWLVLFGLAALAFAVRAALAGAPTDVDAAGKRANRLHHLMASLGMLLMATQPGHGAGGHSHLPAGMTGTLTLTMASAFSVYFLLRAGWLVRTMVTVTSTAGGPGVAFVLRPRVVAGCELLMCAAMSYLLLGIAG